MNCPSRVDPEALPKGWNQNPDQLVLETNKQFSNRANLTQHRDHRIPLEQPQEDALDQDGHVHHPPASIDDKKDAPRSLSASASVQDVAPGQPPRSPIKLKALKLFQTLRKFATFIGPGFMVAVAYIDPGNYATDAAAGASYRFQLLVIIFISNIFAIFLQSLCIKLGSVTGLNLAENIKLHCPPWLNYVLWFFAEAAIIATDIAEVLGSAIALNLLIKVPLVAGCAVSIIDVLIILLFYQPSGSMRGVRYFEIFIILLVLGVVICFCIELSLISVPSVREIFRGYAPSRVLIESQGLYQACGILGATVMPHSLYLGSGIVQPRLLAYDTAHGNIHNTPSPSAPSQNSQSSTPKSTSQGSRAQADSHSQDSMAPRQPTNDRHSRPASPAPSTASSESTTSTATASTSAETTERYRPSLAAIRHCLPLSILELSLSLATFALFVNSSILIVAGATLSSIPDAADASLFSIHDLFSKSLAPFAGTVFALALLLSGTSAGIVCTIAGQMVSEGQLGWATKPWVRRLVVRSISITPSIIVAGSVGKAGVSAALEGTQVALSVILPFVSAPLVWFTCRAKYMGAGDSQGSGDENEEDGPRQQKNMRNSVLMSVVAVVIWGIIVVMNVAALVLVGLGKG